MYHTGMNTNQKYNETIKKEFNDRNKFNNKTNQNQFSPYNNLKNNNYENERPNFKYNNKIIKNKEDYNNYMMTGIDDIRNKLNEKKDKIENKILKIKNDYFYDDNDIKFNNNFERSYSSSKRNYNDSSSTKVNENVKEIRELKKKNFKKINCLEKKIKNIEKIEKNQLKKYKKNEKKLKKSKKNSDDNIYENYLENNFNHNKKKILNTKSSNDKSNKKSDTDSNYESNGNNFKRKNLKKSINSSSSSRSYNSNKSNKKLKKRKNNKKYYKYKEYEKSSSKSNSSNYSNDNFDININQYFNYLLNFCNNHMIFNDRNIIPKYILISKINEERIIPKLINNHNYILSKVFENKNLTLNEIKSFFNYLQNNKMDSHKEIKNKEFIMPEECKMLMKNIFKNLDINNDYVVDRELYINYLKNDKKLKKYLNNKVIFLPKLNKKIKLEKIWDQILMEKNWKVDNYYDENNKHSKKYISWYQFINYFKNFKSIISNKDNMNIKNILTEKMYEIYVSLKKNNDFVRISKFIKYLKNDNFIRNNFGSIVNKDNENVSEIIYKLENYKKDYINWKEFNQFLDNYTKNLVENENENLNYNLTKNLSKTLNKNNALDNYNNNYKQTYINSKKNIDNKRYEKHNIKENNYKEFSNKKDNHKCLENSLSDNLINSYDTIMYKKQKNKDNKLNYNFNKLKETDNDYNLYYDNGKSKNKYKRKRMNKTLQNKNFKTKEIPWYCSKVINIKESEEREKIRKENINKRAQEWLKQSKLPPRMEKYQQEKKRNIIYKSLNLKKSKEKYKKENNLIFHPKITKNMPDFEKEQLKFQKILFKNKKNKQPTKPCDFQFNQTKNKKNKYGEHLEEENKKLLMNDKKNIIINNGKISENFLYDKDIDDYNPKTTKNHKLLIDYNKNKKENYIKNKIEKEKYYKNKEKQKYENSKKFKNTFKNYCDKLDLENEDKQKERDKLKKEFNEKKFKPNHNSKTIYDKLYDERYNNEEYKEKMRKLYKIYKKNLKLNKNLRKTKKELSDDEDKEILENAIFFKKYGYLKKK